MVSSLRVRLRTPRRRVSDSRVSRFRLNAPPTASTGGVSGCSSQESGVGRTHSLFLSSVADRQPVPPTSSGPVGHICTTIPGADTLTRFLPRVSLNSVKDVVSIGPHWLTTGAVKYLGDRPRGFTVLTAWPNPGRAVSGEFTSSRPSRDGSAGTHTRTLGVSVRIGGSTPPDNPRRTADGGV